MAKSMQLLSYSTFENHMALNFNDINFNAEDVFLGDATQANF